MQVTEATTDLRETLFNEPATGAIHDVQKPLAGVYRLRGIMWDLDPKLLKPDNTIFPPAGDTKAFYAKIKAILGRHPLARSAEVRSSGTGLHVILWLDSAVELKTAADQAHWDAIVKVVQRTLPSDPDMPGITAVTRPLGSINGKNGAVVEVLQAGKSVTPKEVQEYVARVEMAPFKEIAVPLLGGDHVKPCPICKGKDRRLDVLDFVGKCYNGCSKVTGDQLFDCVYCYSSDQLASTDVAMIPSIEALIAGKVEIN
jgi:hypothetical protein